MDVEAPAVTGDTIFLGAAVVGVAVTGGVRVLETGAEAGPEAELSAGLSGATVVAEG